MGIRHLRQTNVPRYNNSMVTVEVIKVFTKTVLLNVHVWFNFNQ